MLLIRTILLPLLLSVSLGVQIAAADRPNFLIIISDDQPSGTLGKFMPLTQQKIFDAGVQFSHAYITTPACCPSRSSILTGMYASKHGVLTNHDRLKHPTFAETLQQNGYHTGLVGKYLNSWRGEKRPEFDFWVSFPGGSSTYQDPLLNVQGQWQEHQGYMTYILKQYAEEFLASALQKNEPFALIVTPNAPHDPFTPAESDRGRWQTAALHRPPSFDERNRSKKPAWVRRWPGLTAEWIKKIDIRRARQLEMLWSLDGSVGAMLDQLEAAGKLDSTVVMYISDNGYLWGEHGLRPGKDAAYEEATRVPFAIRYPGLSPTPSTFEHLAANIDIAPTVYDLAGIPIPREMDGVSLLRLVRGEIPPRPALMLEGFRNDEGRKPFVALVTERYKYIENYRDLAELYDLTTDPYELQNIHRQVGQRQTKRELRKLLGALMRRVGRQRRITRRGSRHSSMRWDRSESAQFHTVEELEQTVR